MGSAFKIEPKVNSVAEFKNGVGKVIAKVIKTNDNMMIFSCSVKNFSLNDKEQGRLFDFLLENM
jgi:hypothetical protein